MTDGSWSDVWASPEALPTTQVRASQARHPAGNKAAFTEALQALSFSGCVNTAFIERVNLTIRHGVSALARRTWATALQPPHVQAHVHWWHGYYHFVRPHTSLRVALVQTREGDGRQVKPRYRQRTEADGSWQNQSQMDLRGGAQLPAAAGPCLRADEAENPPTVGG